MKELSYQEILKLHDASYTCGLENREDAANDLIFYYLTQWDDDAITNSSDLSYLGQFDMLRRAGRDILADLRDNPVSIDYYPLDEARDDGAVLLDGLYRTLNHENTSSEAEFNALTESVVCGFGAYKYETKYKTNRIGEEQQVIKKKAIYEANNVVYYDPNAKASDKSDAKYCTILNGFSEEGYKEFVKDLTGKECESISSFDNPALPAAFNWVNGDTYYVGEFYHRAEIKDEIYIFSSPIGESRHVLKSSIEDVFEELMQAGFSLEEERKIKRPVIHKYIVDGKDILAVEEIAGEHIPVVPFYGERAIINGSEHFEGIVRLAKDAQRLRNFMFSYLVDFASKSPRSKPIMTVEQMKGLERFYENGPDNNYPFYLVNSVDSNNAPIPVNVGQMPDSSIPPSFGMLMDGTRQAIEDVANPGVPQDITDTNLSGNAISQIKSKLDKQSAIYQQNRKHSARYSAAVFASIASQVIDTPREMTITKPDGRRDKVKVLESIVDSETGDIVVLNDLTNSEFEVYAKTGQSYNSQKEKNAEKLLQMAATVQQTDPALHKLLTLQVLQQIEGEDVADIRKYCRNQLIVAGITEPETKEEQQMLQQLQMQQAEQAQAPDPMMLAAQAEIAKGQGALLQGQSRLIAEQRKAQYDDQKLKNEQAKINIDSFNARTDRIAQQIQADRYGAELQLKQNEALRKETQDLLSNSFLKGVAE